MARINIIKSSFSTGEISPTLFSRVDLDMYKNALATCSNFIISQFGGAYFRSGTAYIEPLDDQTNTAILIPFQYSNTQAYVLEFSPNQIRFYKDQGIILNSMGSAPYTVTTTFTTSDFDAIRRGYAQTFDTLYFCTSKGVYKLQRFDHNNWSLSKVSFVEPPYLDQNSTSTTITPSATTGSITITASSGIFASTDVGRAIRYKSGPDRSKVIEYSGTGSQTNYDIPFYPQGSGDIQVNFIEATGARTAKTYTSSGSPSTGQFTIVNSQIICGDTPGTSQRVEILPKYAGSGQWGWALITAYTSSTSVTATVQTNPDGTGLAGTNASTLWRLGAWSDTTGYPSIACFHEQRLWFGGSTTQPQTVWGSATGDYENFAPDNLLRTGLVDPDTAVTFGLVTDSVQFLQGVRVLVAGAGDSLITMQGPSTGAISSTDILTRKDSAIPCEFEQTSKTASEVIFIERVGKKIHAASYDFRIDSYRPNEITLLVDHLVSNSKYKYLCYAPTPNKMLWALKDDGNIVSCTYNKDQELTAWAQHQIGGTDVFIESIATISGSTYSELWLLVRRTINGSTTRYVEVMQPRFFQMDKTDAFFVDSGLQYSGSSTTTLSGLDHLEGETVKINANGAAHPDKVVSSGQVTLDFAVTKASVGLGYNGILETVPFEGGSRLGTAQGITSRIRRVVLRLFETIGVNIGYSSDSQSVPIIFKQGNDLLGQGPSLFTGYKPALFPEGWNPDYKVYITQEQPLPCTILGITVQAEVSDQ